jgi:hypothetical protein
MKETTMFVFAITLCSVSLQAQKPKPIEYGGDLRFEAPTQEEPAALTKIFSNLGGPASAYSSSAFDLYGPTYDGGTYGFEYVAMAFKPQANAHVSEVRAAIQYNGSGANRVNLSLYSDVNGVPGGVPLAGPVTVTNLPTFPTCCTLAIAKFSAVAVTAGAQYWVVGDTPPPAQEAISLEFGPLFLPRRGWLAITSALVGNRF